VNLVRAVGAVVGAVVFWVSEQKLVARVRSRIVSR
jgi:hypothetical protein